MWHSTEDINMGNDQYIYPWYEFETYWFKITAASPRHQGVKCMKLTDLRLQLHPQGAYELNAPDL